jgi:hypothetical protein
MKSQAIADVRRLLETRQRELKAELKEIETALKKLSPRGGRRKPGSQAQTKAGTGRGTRLT